MAVGEAERIAGARQCRWTVLIAGKDPMRLVLEGRLAILMAGVEMLSRLTGRAVAIEEWEECDG